MCISQCAFPYSSVQTLFLLMLSCTCLDLADIHVTALLRGALVHYAKAHIHTYLHTCTKA